MERSPATGRVAHRASLTHPRFAVQASPGGQGILCDAAESRGGLAAAADLVPIPSNCSRLALRPARAPAHSDFKESTTFEVRPGYGLHCRGDATLRVRVYGVRVALRG